jgi:hypothetical protein
VIAAWNRRGSENVWIGASRRHQIGGPHFFRRRKKLFLSTYFFSDEMKSADESTSGGAVDPAPIQFPVHSFEKL